MVTELALHPAARRKIAALMPPTAPDQIVLSPLGAGGPQSLIVPADEQAFIDAVMADLAADDWQTSLDARRKSRRHGVDGTLELTQPVHRRFHLVLLEAFCSRPGSPRLDPAKLDSQGLVIRRLSDTGQQAWMINGPKKLGWVDLSGQDLDPDPDRRNWTPPTPAGQIAARVLALRRVSAWREEVLPLFPAPPDVCSRMKRTVFFGLVPITSSDRAETPTLAPNYRALDQADGTAIRQHLSEYLKQRPAMTMPLPGQALDPGWKVLNLDASTGVDDARLNSFGIFLQQLMSEFAAFDPPGADSSMVRLLNRIPLPMQVDGQGNATRTMPAGDFCRTAAAILIGGDANKGAGGFDPLIMPYSWPAIDAALGSALTDEALASLSRRFAALAPGSPKFDGDAPLYIVRPFIRVKGHDGCPVKLVWADPSEPFRILPWWDGDGPATIIPLPDPTDFKKMKPNVAFQVPPTISNLLRGDPKKTLKDGPSGGGGVEIMWLCSFSIPIITICAFFTLNIFLSLFDLFFFWMAFIKICIPIPFPKSAPKQTP
jgi:hypothetical protein